MLIQLDLSSGSFFLDSGPFDIAIFLIDGMLDDSNVIGLVFDFLINLLDLLFDFSTVLATLQPVLGFVDKVNYLMNLGQHIGFDSQIGQSDTDMFGWGKIDFLLISQLVKVIPMYQYFFVVIDYCFVFFCICVLVEVYSCWNRLAHLVHLITELTLQKIVIVGFVIVGMDVETEGKSSKQQEKWHQTRIAHQFVNKFE